MTAAKAENVGPGIKFYFSKCREMMTVQRETKMKRSPFCLQTNNMLIYLKRNWIVTVLVTSMQASLEYILSATENHNWWCF